MVERLKSQIESVPQCHHLPLVRRLETTIHRYAMFLIESGCKGFILIHRAAGRQRRMTIGTWPSWSVVAARDEAKRLKRDIDRG